MGFLHTFLFALWILTAILLAIVACAGMGWGLRKLRALGHRFLGRPSPTNESPLWPTIVACVVVMAALLAAGKSFPNEARLSHLIDKLVGYKSTRIVIALQQDDPATQQALVDALRPFMEIGGRTIRYRRKSRYGPSNVLAEDVPSHYRFINGTMEIAAGGIVGGDRLTMLQTGFGALAKFATTDAIAHSVPATVHIGSTRITVEMLPLTARLIDNTAPREWMDIPQRPSPGSCALEVQALFSSEAFPVLFRGAHASGEVELLSAPTLRDTHYALVGLGLVRGKHGRMVKEQAENRTRIYGVLRLLPPDFRLGAMDCDTALPRMVDPALMAAGMLAAFPSLEGRIAGVSVQNSVRFSPWHERGWTAVPPHSNAEAGELYCEVERRRDVRALTAAIMGNCLDNGGSRMGDCASLHERTAWTSAELARCRGDFSPSQTTRDNR